MNFKRYERNKVISLYNSGKSCVL